ncbi:MAG: antibiotic biosynthesis monooxygenase family protein [Dehalococcoidia bacterium]
MTEPVLMLLGVYLKGMAPLPLWFLRLRRLEGVLRQQPGALKSHRYISRRSLLLVAWWRDRQAALAWLQHPAYRRLERWARREPVAGFWVELYRQESGGLHHGQSGAPRP